MHQQRIGKAWMHAQLALDDAYRAGISGRREGAGQDAAHRFQPGPQIGPLGQALALKVCVLQHQQCGQ